MQVQQTGSHAAPTAAPAVLSKSAYAERRGVHKSAVSHWIRQGRLHGPALTGRGRGARIVVEAADRQLAEGLDPTQQLANGKPAPAGAEGDADTAASAPVASHQDRYQKARADQAEVEAERSRRRIAAEQGLYTETAAAREAWARELGELLTATELWLAEAAEAVAVATGADRRAVAVVLKREWRRFRERQGERARGRADERPELAEAEAEAERAHAA